MLAALEDRGAGDEGCLVALGTLYEAPAAGGKVVDDLRRMKAQPIEIDQVDIGALARLQPAAIMEAEEIGRLAGLPLHHEFERQPRPALPIAGLTARQVIDELKIGPGFRLLITGGAGATGAVVVQMAAAAGAEVTITASAHHRDRLTRLGARQVVDYHQLDWTSGVEGSFDAALTAAPGTGADAIALVRDGGRLLTLTGDAPESERGIESGDFYVEPNGAQLEQLAALVAFGRLVLNAEPIRLQEAVAAFEGVHASTTGGRKVVLTFSSDNNPH